MTIEWISHWRHVFKLDPDRELADDALDRLCSSGTDAILVGGSSGLTYDNTVQLLSRIRRYAVPVALEVSSVEVLVPGFDLYLIPFVWNTPDADWMMGYQQEAIRDLGARMPWEIVAAEGYIILNEDSTAARITRARTGLDAADVAAYARMAEHLFHLPILYIEYSGAFGDMKLVEAAAAVCKQTRLFYGGGIDGRARAEEAARYADTIVVGNMIYEDIERALETVRLESTGKGIDE